MDVIFHGYTNEKITLIDVSHVSGLGFNLYSLHIVQKYTSHSVRRFRNAHYRLQSDVPPQQKRIVLACNPVPRRDCRDEKKGKKHARKQLFKAVARTLPHGNMCVSDISDSISSDA